MNLNVNLPLLFLQIVYVLCENREIDRLATATQGGRVKWAITWLVDMICGHVRGDLTLSSAPPDIISQQADFIPQLWTDLETAFSPWVQSDLESVDVVLNAPQCVLGMILQPVQLILHLSAQLTVLTQQLHLCHDSVKVFAVIPGQSLDLPDIMAQVHNLSDDLHVNIHNDHIKQ